MAVSKRLRFEVFRRDNHTCRYCGATAPDVKLTIDHVTPTALGGKDEPSNLVTACGPCNSGKTSTNPDSPLVASVVDDALRWSAAIKRSADQLLADLNVRQQQRAEFDRRWNEWGSGAASTDPIPRPVDWPNTIDRFIASGLPMPVLLDCLDRAMGNSKVRPDSTFRYMCGIAWARITELQEGARQGLGIDQPETGGAEVVVELSSGRADLAVEILQDMFEAEQEELLRSARELAEESLEPGEILDEDEVVASAAHDAVVGLGYRFDFLRKSCEALLETMPPDVIDLCERGVREDNRRFVPDGEAGAEVTVEGVISKLARIRSFRALPYDVQQSYLDRVGNDDAETYGLAQFLTPAEDQAFSAARAAHSVRMGWHANGCSIPPDVEGHAPCLKPAHYLLWFQDCWRHEDGSSCEGHRSCSPHAHEFSDGRRINPSTSNPTALLRFEETDPWGSPPF